MSKNIYENIIALYDTYQFMAQKEANIRTSELMSLFDRLRSLERQDVYEKICSELKEILLSSKEENAQIVESWLTKHNLKTYLITKRLYSFKFDLTLIDAGNPFSSGKKILISVEKSEIDDFLKSVGEQGRDYLIRENYVYEFT